MCLKDQNCCTKDLLLRYRMYKDREFHGKCGGILEISVKPFIKKLLVYVGFGDRRN
jgi:hypothetical protein